MHPCEWAAKKMASARRRSLIHAGLERYALYSLHHQPSTLSHVHSQATRTFSLILANTFDLSVQYSPTRRKQTGNSLVHPMFNSPLAL